MARHHGNGAELAHRPGVAEHHTVEQAPLDVRQGDAPEDLQPEAPSSPPPPPPRCRASMIGISSRATNGAVTKRVARTMPGTAKMT